MVTSQSSIKSIDPSFAPAYVTTVTSQHIWEQLWTWDSNYVARPQMVGDWSISADGKTYTITLRDGLKFHDGAPVKAEDVVASFGRWWEKQAAGQLVLSFLEEGGAKAVSNNTLTMTFNEPFGALLNASSIPHRYPPIYPKRIGEMTAFEDIGEDNLIGSAAYKMKLWEPGNRVVLERFEDYEPRGEAGSFLAGAQTPYFDEIEWLEIPSEETKIAGLTTGDWDIVDGAGLDFFQPLSQNSDIRIVSYPGHQSTVQIHVSRPPTDNVLVRRAILAAIDSEAMMSSLGPTELWRLCPAVYYCGTPLESQAGAEFYNQNDPDKARALLAEAGYNGETIIINNPTDYGTITPLGLVLKPLLENVGFNVDMPAIDWATLISLLRTEDYNMFTTWWAQWSASDPITDPVVAGTTGYAGNYANPELLDLRLQYVAAPDYNAQKAIVDQIQTIYYNDVPKIFLGQFSSIFPHRTYIKNLEVPAMPVYFNVWSEK